MPPNVAMVKGTGLHGGAEVNYKQKVETCEDLPEDDVLEATADKFDEASESIDDWTEERGKALDATIGAAKMYHAELAPTVQPVESEGFVELAAPGWKWKVIGYVDVETESSVIDIKMSGKRKSQGDVDRSLQGEFYMAATGKDAFSFHVVTPKATQVLDRVEPSNLTRTIERIEGIQNCIDTAIKTDTFAPAAEGSWACSERFCGYWNLCVYGGRH